MKKWLIVIFWGAMTVLVFGASAFFYSRSHRQNIQNQPVLPQVQTQTPVPASLYFPMTDFDNRITFRSFGQLVRPNDFVSPCGSSFSGYHDADDLEVAKAEIVADVSVYAIADATIREVGPVSGYGGLLVLGTTINGQSYTVYYGHIDLGSTTLVVGETVKAGQRLASLGAECSVQTSGERKHLHFAMHLGTAVDVRGYVPDQDTLASWIDPKAYLTQNGAVKPQ